MKKTIELILVLLALSLFANVAKADFTFGTPSNLGPTVNSSAVDSVPSVSADGLELYFVSDRTGGYGGYDLWVATRATTGDDWGIPANLGPTINSSQGVLGPHISRDGLSLYFASNQPGGYGGWDIYVTTRLTLSDPWDTPVNLGPPVNSSANDVGLSISADGLSLFFDSQRSGGSGGPDLWITTRATKDDDWGEPMNLGPTVNSSVNDGRPNISPDGLTLFFTSKRPGGSGDADLWMTTRATKDDPWTGPVNLGSTVNSVSLEFGPGISADGSTLYFVSGRSGGIGGGDIWQALVIPIIDLNGDGLVDAADMCIMVDHWGTDEPSCDIGPMPWGDSIVDVQDLVALSEHLFTYPGAVAHWKLDETEGMLARDDVSGSEDVVMGGALWQPTGGKVGGALELDGADDCLIAAFGLNPADPEISSGFSIFAWIKGGGPGQTIISEPMGTDWLAVDAEGKLVTDLKSAGADGSALSSQTVITDGAWHRIGFVWDGSQRMLYIDGVVVAEDTQDGLEASASGLYIGVGNNYAPGSFFSGLIDDVCIYNRVLTP